MKLRLFDGGFVCFEPLDQDVDVKDTLLGDFFQLDFSIRVQLHFSRRVGEVCDEVGQAILCPVSAGIGGLRVGVLTIEYWEEGLSAIMSLPLWSMYFATRYDFS